MYDLTNIQFGKKLNEYRKARKLTLETLGTRIGKTKATISKYESEDIMPDLLTILEICNTLGISISQLLPLSTSTNYKQNYIFNPFNTDRIYMYYYTNNLLIKSVLEIIMDSTKIFVRFYNGVTDINTYTDNVAYTYDGIMECDKTIGYMNLYNTESQGTQFEKLQISFNIAWSKKFKITNFFILGLTPNSIPIVKKGIMSIYPLKDLHRFDDDLKISTNEFLKIKENNAWILENKNYAHFFFDM